MSLSTRIDELKKEIDALLSSINTTEDSIKEAKAAHVLNKQGLLKKVSASVSQSHTPKGLAVQNPFDVSVVFTKDHISQALSSIFK